MSSLRDANKGAVMGRVYAGARRALPPRRRKGRVRVRDTSAGRELWVDGTFASLYRPGRATTGTVWDAIAAPIAWLPPRRRRRVLLLGLAGGSVARVVRALAPRAEIVGVEFDAAVLAAAGAAEDAASCAATGRSPASIASTTDAPAP